MKNVKNIIQAKSNTVAAAVATESWQKIADCVNAGEVFRTWRRPGETLLQH